MYSLCNNNNKIMILSLFLRFFIRWILRRYSYIIRETNQISLEVLVPEPNCWFYWNYSYSWNLEFRIRCASLVLYINNFFRDFKRWFCSMQFLLLFVCNSFYWVSQITGSSSQILKFRSKGHIWSDLRTKCLEQKCITRN